jgi:hypothetical protein
MSDAVNFEILFKSSAAKEFRNLPQDIKKESLLRLIYFPQIPSQKM